MLKGFVDASFSTVGFPDLSFARMKPRLTYIVLLVSIVLFIIASLSLYATDLPERFASDAIVSQSNETIRETPVGDTYETWEESAANSPLPSPEPPSPPQIPSQPSSPEIPAQPQPPLIPQPLAPAVVPSDSVRIYIGIVLIPSTSEH
jgi:hypothetical protein